MTWRVGTTGGGSGADGLGDGRKYGLGTGAKPGGGVDEGGRVRGGSWRSPVDGIGGRLKSSLALLRHSNVLVWLQTLRRSAQLMIGWGALLWIEHVVGCSRWRR